MTDFQADSFSDPQTKSYAAFGQVDWHITDALTLTGGLRYTHEDKQATFRQFQSPDSGNDVSMLPPAQAARGRDPQPAAYQRRSSFSARLKDDAVSGLVTLGYKVTPDVLLYAHLLARQQIGRAERHRRRRQLVRWSIPEKVDAYEIGLKSQLLDQPADR